MKDEKLKAFAVRVQQAKKFHDTSMYHKYPPPLRPVVIAGELTRMLQEFEGKRYIPEKSREYCVQVLHHTIMHVGDRLWFCSYSAR